MTCIRERGTHFLRLFPGLIGRGDAVTGLSMAGAACDSARA